MNVDSECNPICNLNGVHVVAITLSYIIAED